MPLTTNGCPLSRSWNSSAFTTALVARGIVPAVTSNIRATIGENFATSVLVFKNGGIIVGPDGTISSQKRQGINSSTQGFARHYCRRELDSHRLKPKLFILIAVVNALFG